jgi:pimeloyl-ACP methyl ester carboxylesterase
VTKRGLWIVLLGVVIGGWAASGVAARASQATQAPASAAGQWSGHISLPPGPLNVGVTLTPGAAGVWTGTIDIPAQGANGVPLVNITVNGSAVSFVMDGVPGDPRFAGTMSADGQTITGTFTQGPASLPFELKRGALTYARPQEPRAPFPYRTEDVSYRNDAADITIAGTLTVPQGAGPFPAVLLISGSGAQDRDSTLFGHKPFLLWADTLTRRGFAVLRVDDRGVGGTGAGSAPPTTLDFAGDARAGLTFLASRPEVDAKRLGLVGHSEGANIAAMVAADDPRVRFIVMLGGTGVPGDQVLLRQFEALVRAQGAPQDIIDWQLAIRRRVFEHLRAEKGQVDEAARGKLIAGLPPMPGTGAVEPSQGLATALFQSMNPWLEYFMVTDPRDSISRVKVPVLALFGELDLQVVPAQNEPAVRAALEAAGNTDVTVRVMPRLNHLFQTAKTGANTEYEQIEETVAPEVLTLVADWLVERAGS